MDILVIPNQIFNEQFIVITYCNKNSGDSTKEHTLGTVFGRAKSIPT